MSTIAEELLEGIVHDAAENALREVRKVEDPIERLEAVAATLDMWRAAESTLLDARRAMVEGFEQFLSYRQMAEALGCSKANIHQILHPTKE